VVALALDWFLDVLFSKDLVQFRTLRAPAISHAENGTRSAELRERESTVAPTMG
jgi:hypothetical protein